MVVGLLVVIVLGLILCVLYELSQDPSNGYRARHRAPGRVSWWAEESMRLRRHVNRAKRAAYLRMMVIPAEPESWPELPPAQLRLNPDRHDSRWDVLATRALDAEAQLARKGLRLRQAAPDELVGAA
jgi:hypothetical protein